MYRAKFTNSISACLSHREMTLIEQQWGVKKKNVVNESKGKNRVKCT